MFEIKELGVVITDIITESNFIYSPHYNQYTLHVEQEV